MVLAKQLDPTAPLEVQLAALKALTRLDERASAEAVVSRWTELGPAVRSGALDAMLARPGSTDVILGAMERNQLPPASIDAAHREQLLSQGPTVARQRASRAFGSRSIGPRQGALNAFESVKTIHGDSESGRKVFSAHNTPGTVTRSAGLETRSVLTWPRLRIPPRMPY